MFVDTNGVIEMLRLFTKTTELAVEFCDRCSSVCTAADRREALLSEARAKALVFGGRFG
jgi:hypothetical protein